MNKLALARLMESTGALQALLAVRGITRLPWLPVLTYHRIADRDASRGLHEDVIDAWPEQFERQIAFLSRRFRFLSMADLTAHLHGAPLPPNPVMLTFDDGYLECATRVLPILQRYGARATFFVSTRYITERRLFWWDYITRVVGESARDRLELSYPYRVAWSLDGDRSLATDGIIRLVKTHVGLDLDRFLEHLAEAAGVTWSRAEEADLVDDVLMQWSDVRALAGAGMDVHSHTRTHRVLHTLAPEQVEDELAGSRADLEEQLDRPVDALSYPVGYPVAHIPHVREALRSAGYRVAFTNQTGVNHTARQSDPYDMRRISMTTAYQDVFFRAMMVLPHLAPLRRVVPVTSTWPRAAECSAHRGAAPTGLATDATPASRPNLHKRGLRP